MKPLSIEVACRLRTDGLNSFKLQSIVSASAFPKLQFVHPKWDRQQFRQQSTTTKDRQNNTHMNIRGMKIIIEPTFTNLFLEKNGYTKTLSISFLTMKFPLAQVCWFLGTLSDPFQTQIWSDFQSDFELKIAQWSSMVRKVSVSWFCAIILSWLGKWVSQYSDRSQ